MNKLNKVIPLRLGNSLDTPLHQNWFISSYTNLNCLVLHPVCLFRFLWCFLSFTAEEGVHAVMVPVLEKDHLNICVFRNNYCTVEPSSAQLFAVFAMRVSASPLLYRTSICASQNLLERSLVSCFLLGVFLSNSFFWEATSRETSRM